MVTRRGLSAPQAPWSAVAPATALRSMCPGGSAGCRGRHLADSATRSRPALGNLCPGIEESGSSGGTLRHGWRFADGSPGSGRIAAQGCRLTLMETRTPALHLYTRLGAFPLRTPMYLLRQLPANGVQHNWGSRLKTLLSLDASDGIDDENRHRGRVS